MFTDAITDAVTSLWDRVWYYTTLAFVDPFWGWFLWLIVLYFVVMIVCYFFGMLWPPLRWIGGVMLLIATFGLFTYARGERDAREHDAKRKPRSR